MAEGMAKGMAEGMVKGMAEGKEIGRAEGLEIGEKRKAIETAKQMRSDGIPIESILRYTGLTAEDIETL